jgi:Holliday junction resolvase
MPNRFYEAGDRFEKRVMKDLTNNGYTCWQTRGSKTAVDIIALGCDSVLLVQVKSGDRIVEHAPWNELYDLAVRASAGPVVADRDGRNIRYRLITGHHQHGSRNWPADEYQP